MDIGAIFWTVVAGAVVLFTLHVGRANDRYHQRNVSRGRWVDLHMSQDDRRRSMRRVRDQAMWDAVAERDRRRAQRR